MNSLPPAATQGGGSYWLVSEHMPGGSLAERLQRHRAADDAGRTQWPLSERLQSGLEVGRPRAQSCPLLPQGPLLPGLALPPPSAPPC